MTSPCSWLIPQGGTALDSLVPFAAHVLRFFRVHYCRRDFSRTRRCGSRSAVAPLWCASRAPNPASSAGPATAATAAPACTLTSALLVSLLPSDRQPHPRPPRGLLPAIWSRGAAGGAAACGQEATRSRCARACASLRAACGTRRDARARARVSARVERRIRWVSVVWRALGRQVYPHRGEILCLHRQVYPARWHQAKKCTADPSPPAVASLEARHVHLYLLA